MTCDRKSKFSTVRSSSP